MATTVATEKAPAACPEGKLLPLNGGLVGAEECIGEGRIQRHIGGTLAAGNGFHSQIDDGAVAIGVRGQQSGAGRIGVVADVACGEERCGNGYDFACRDEGIEDIIGVVQLRLVLAEIRHDVRIGIEQADGASGDGQGGQPVTAFGQSGPGRARSASGHAENPWAARARSPCARWRTRPDSPMPAAERGCWAGRRRDPAHESRGQESLRRSTKNANRLNVFMAFIEA